MRNIFLIFFGIIMLSIYPGNVTAQEKPKTQISTVKQKGEIVRFTIISSKPFIFGSNRYVLYIGNKEFLRNEQSHKNGKGSMTFLIPSSDFLQLPDGVSMYLTYGNVNYEDVDMDELAKNSRKCWSLGKFSQNLLTK